MGKAKKSTVRPGKDIVASMAGELKKKLLTAVEKGAEELVVDFKGVGMVDSVGLGIIIAAHNSIQKAGGKLRVINVSEDIHGLFKAMRLDKHFEVVKA